MLQRLKVHSLQQIYIFLRSVFHSPLNVIVQKPSEALKVLCCALSVHLNMGHLFQILQDQVLLINITSTRQTPLFLT